MMIKNLFQQLEAYRKKQDLSILALCRKLETHNVNYHRWRKAGDITGPYKKIIEAFLSSRAGRSSIPKVQPSYQIKSESISDIAVIGMSCFYPGARNVKELWENILARRVQFRRILDQRLPLADYYDEDAKSEKSYLTKAAFIDEFNFAMGQINRFNSNGFLMSHFRNYKRLLGMKHLKFGN